MSAYKQKCVWLGASAAAVFTMCAAGAIAQGPEKSEQRYETFTLKNATNQRTANDIQTALRNMIPAAKVYYAATENTLSVSGRAEDVALAQRILADLDKPQKLYRVTYTINDGHAAPRRLTMLVSPGRRGITKQGTRVPIMTGSYKESGAHDANTQFQYQDIGLNVDADIEGYGDGQRLTSKIEATSVSDQKSNVGIQDPLVDQSVLEAQSFVNSSKPVMLGSIDLAEGKHMDVQVAIEAVQ
ncbi:secretin N-terminal domain-containing protein [Occallatibacter savannae]|uniref:secretin N-terminal domain-containing protein n=1 Tax=Occallatibacter savannae TaxID=1002691 RepID=UPI0013A5A94B|nr:secretin N-terminal domain-containing protein [Occallatibacter savannae]